MARGGELSDGSGLAISFRLSLNKVNPLSLLACPRANSSFAIEDSRGGVADIGLMRIETPLVCGGRLLLRSSDPGCGAQMRWQSRVLRLRSLVAAALHA